MRRLRSAMAPPWHREDGQTMVEYTVVLGVITIGIIAAIAALSGATQGGYERLIAIFNGI